MKLGVKEKPGSQWIGGCVNRSADQDVVGKRFTDSSDRPARSLVTELNELSLFFIKQKGE
jgi:hypothetical protein